MKHLAVMIALTSLGAVGALLNPFYGISIYYLFAVLRPQFLWQWALPPGIHWSTMVAIPTLLATVWHSLTTPEIPSDDKKREHWFAWTHLWMLAFGGWIVLSYITAYDREVAYFWFLEYVKIFVMFGAAALVIRSVSQVWTLMVITTASLAYIAYEINMLYLFHENMNIWLEGYGGIDNNGAGLMLAMGIPLCIFMWEGTRRPWRWIYIASLPFLLHAVLMTFSRGAMLTLLLTSPLVYLRSRSKGFMTVAAVCGLMALPIMAGKEIRERFFSIQSYQRDNSAQGRISSMRAGLGIALDNPVLGVGPRNANLFTFQYGADMENRTIHNLYLQLAADGGFVAAALYVTALFSFWRGVRRLRRQIGKVESDEDRQVAAIANGLECAMAMFVVGAMFLALDVFELPYLLVLLGAQMQLLWGPKPGTVSAPEKAPAAFGAPLPARASFQARAKASAPIGSR